MIVASLLLILVAVMLLVFGLSGGSSTLLISSIVASLLAAVALVIGARQSAAARRNAAPEPFDADADSPANGQIFAAESAEMARSAPPADSDLRETVQLEPVPPMGASGAHDEPDPSGIRDESGYGSDPARAADSGYVAEADYAADTNYDGRTDAVRDDQPDEHAWQHAEATGLADAAAARPAYADPESRPAYAADPETRPAYAADPESQPAYAADPESRPAYAADSEADRGFAGPGAEPRLAEPVPEPRFAESEAEPASRFAGSGSGAAFAEARAEPEFAEPEFAEPDDDDPADEPLPQAVSPADAVRVARMDAEVLVVDGRPRYHVADCPHLVDRLTEPLPVNEAVELGFTPCGLCRPVDRLVAATARR